MKGVILAGGMGTRLLPLTKVINKCLLPIYDKPLIYYPIQTLKQLGIKDIMVILGGQYIGQVMHVLEDGREFGVNFTYKIQNHPSGIAHGFKMAKDFVGEHNVALILGDNIFFDDMLKLYHEDSPYKATPTVFLKKVTDPHRFGCVEFKKKDGSIKSIVEKPLQPPSDMIVTGLYIYPSTVFDVIDKLKPSKRGEYEISEVSDIYAKRGELKHKVLKKSWIDAGTFKSLLMANEEMGK